MNIYLLDSTYLISALYIRVPKAPVILHRLYLLSTTSRTAKLPHTIWHYLRYTPYRCDTVRFTCKGATDNPPSRFQNTTSTAEYNLRRIAGNSHHRIAGIQVVGKESQSHQREEYTTLYCIVGREVHSSASVLWDPLSPYLFLELKYHSIVISVSYDIAPLPNRTTTEPQ